jgi:hypothetical protein
LLFDPIGGDFDFRSEITDRGEANRVESHNDDGFRAEAQKKVGSKATGNRLFG